MRASFIPAKKQAYFVIADHPPDSWNDAVVQAAYGKAAPAEMMPMVVYAASKTEGERAAWTWYQENKPKYAFNTVLPNFNV